MAFTLEPKEKFINELDKFINALDEIDGGTPYTLTPPDWWLELSSLRRLVTKVKENIN